MNDKSNGKSRFEGRAINRHMPTAAETYRWVTRTPGIRGGNARVKGTRIGVHDAIGLLQNGETIDSLIANYFPTLTRAQVYGCLVYYEDHRREIDLLVARQMSPPTEDAPAASKAGSKKSSAAAPRRDEDGRRQAMRPRRPQIRCDIRGSFATAFRNWRLKNKLPLKRVAADLGVSIATVNKWERGDRFPGERHLGSLVQYTGQPPCRLFCIMADKCVLAGCLLAIGRQP